MAAKHPDEMVVQLLNDSRSTEPKDANPNQKSNESKFVQCQGSCKKKVSKEAFESARCRQSGCPTRKSNLCPRCNEKCHQNIKDHEYRKIKLIHCEGFTTWLTRCKVQTVEEVFESIRCPQRRCPTREYSYCSKCIVKYHSSVKDHKYEQFAENKEEDHDEDSWQACINVCNLLHDIIT